MKVDVFESVAQDEAEATASDAGARCTATSFVEHHDNPETYDPSPRDFIACLFDDVLAAVERRRELRAPSTTSTATSSRSSSR